MRLINQFRRRCEVSEDITVRLRDLLSWENADEAILEIQTLRQDIRDWKQAAEMLAMDLGKIEYASVIYEDIQDGLYDKVRDRIQELSKTTAEAKPTEESIVAELMGAIAEQGYEIHRLREIITNFYLEECAYNAQISDRVDPEYTIPQTWKDAYGAYEAEAMKMINEDLYD